MSQRKSREEWQRILEDQRARNLTDVVCAGEQSVSVSQLKRWRGLIGGRRPAPPALVEVPLFPVDNRNIILNLRRNASIEIPPNWPVTKIAQLVRELGVV